MRRLWAILCGLGSLSLMADSAAQVSESSGGSRSVQLGHEGLALYQEGRWREAYVKFERAETETHSPVFVLYMARTKRNGGQLREAQALFDRVIHEDTSGEKPEAWRQSVRDATAERTALALRIPSVRVTLQRASCGPMRVKVDGHPIDCDELSRPIELDPGPHAVALEGDGTETVVFPVDLAEGDKEKAVELVPRAPSVAKPASAVSSDVVGSPEKRSMLPTLIAFGVGGAGLGLGIVTFSLATRDAARAREGCVENSCPPSNNDDKEAAVRLANVATVGFVVGTVGASVGTILLLTAPSRKAQAPATPSVNVSVAIGPGSIGVTGTF